MKTMKQDTERGDKSRREATNFKTNPVSANLNSIKTLSQPKPRDRAAMHFQSRRGH